MSRFLPSWKTLRDERRLELDLREDTPPGIVNH
jgi:hypothetical protein